MDPIEKTVDVPCPWCGCRDVVIEDCHVNEGFLKVSCLWCGIIGPSVGREEPGLTLKESALKSWETRRTWDETLKRLHGGN